jgi:hypothetical protein
MTDGKQHSYLRLGRQVVNCLTIILFQHIDVFCVVSMRLTQEMVALQTTQKGSKVVVGIIKKMFVDGS